MKIAQIAPLSEAVPPKLYGGTERIVSYLTEELIRQGHQVTLFASGDSVTAAELDSCCPRALRLDPSVTDPVAPMFTLLEKVRRRAREFDVLHFHTDRLHLSMLARQPWCAVTTLHGRLDEREQQHFYRGLNEFAAVSISHAQRKPLPHLNWVSNVYHGLPLRQLPFRATPKGTYLAFLGRISPEKRPDLAIEIARRANLPLRVAAKVDSADRPYFEQVIRPLSAHSPVEFVGEIGEAEKGDFLGDAHALLFPIDWPEPFGLVMIEAMACGTPVIAFPRGAAPEVIDEGVTGFLVRSVDEAVAAVGMLPGLDRHQVRCQFERRFSVTRMAEEYVSLYKELARPVAPQSRPMATDL
jgi:glycosyltransferase involved in cell wall biosynthesis